jgi:membrane protease YdiL (CAAX protease family)
MQRAMRDPQTVTPTPAALLRDFVSYLRGPALLGGEGWQIPHAWRRWGAITALQVAGLALLLPLLHLWQKAFNLPAPNAFDAIPATWLPLIVVLLAPLLEELLFRGWQTGRPRALVLLIGAMLFMAAAVTARPENMGLIGPVLLAVLAATALGWALLRKRGPSG